MQLPKTGNEQLDGVILSVERQINQHSVTGDGETVRALEADMRTVIIAPVSAEIRAEAILRYAFELEREIVMQQQMPLHGQLRDSRSAYVLREATRPRRIV